MPHPSPMLIDESVSFWSTKLVKGLITLAVGGAFTLGTAYTLITMKQEASEAKLAVNSARITRIEEDREEMKKDYFNRMGKLETHVEAIEKNTDRILKKLD